MKSTLQGVGITSCILLYLVNTSRAQEIRVWTSIAGTKLEAKAIKEDNGVVTFQKADGTAIKVAADKLIDPDRHALKIALHQPKEVDVIYYRRGVDDYYTEDGNPKEAIQSDTINFRFKDVEKSLLGSKEIVSKQEQMDSSWKILACEDLGQEVFREKYPDEKSKTTGRYIRLIWTVANKGKEEASIVMPILTDDKQRSHFPINAYSDYTATNRKSYKAKSCDERLGAGFEATISMVYELPLDAVPYSISFGSLANRRVKREDVYISIPATAIDVLLINPIGLKGD